MSTFKKCKVLLLPTNEKSKIILSFKEKSFNQLIEPKLTLIKESNYQLSNIQSQHLYIISDDEIKEGDWCIDSNRNIFQHKNHFPISIGQRKIITTTDSSLGLPQPSQQFIQKYIEEYNRGNIITDVLVEYNYNPDLDNNWDLTKTNDIFKFNTKKEFNDYVNCVKTNPKDNTITIKKVKDSYSREEVIDLLIRAVGESHDWSRENNDIHSIGIIEKRFLNQWIEKNL